ncbi:MAG: penicillin-binding protein 2 [Thermoanaerobacter sp.]|jgi:penicillin-binding protein 2|uniref:penicillin-binding protein 2 n=1 Tax=Desulfofundulus thermocisternus TaxID=42471 RepID=UPI00068DE352|nr:penicillin-binding protein 2 [Desulfofundulus thermocisternus]MDK2888965.1 penicillin-binding protein 2 [Thermoanaerobacter sp.]
MATDGIITSRKVEKKLQVLLGLVIAAFALLFLRLAYLQLVEADKYKMMAQQNHLRLIPIAAPRGEIFDRNGVRIVGNQPVYTISFAYLGVEDTDRVIARLARILVGEKSFQGKTAEEIEQEIHKKLKEQKLRLYEPVPVADKVSSETVSRIEEQRLELPGVLIDVRPVRHYPYGDLLVPTLGYVGIMDQKELEENKDKGYTLGDSWGKDGLEKSFESYLRGRRGARQVEVDAQGQPVRDLGVKEPVPGDNLVLTVDARLQRAVQDALARGIARVQKEGYSQARAGAAVVLDVRTGEILALASHPTYDPTIFTRDLSPQEWNEAWAKISRDQSLLNRALALYPPGSTFKMVVAAAALEMGKITSRFSIYDTGRYKYKMDWKPGGHGRVDVVRALKVSCDTFFWTVGAMLGPEPIARYAREFGLGQKTGVELPGEHAGRIPGPEQKYKLWKPLLDNVQRQMDEIRKEYEKRLAGAGEGERAALEREMNRRLAPLQEQYSKIEWELTWREYDTLDMSIGQGNNYYTPLQLANYIAAIANGGTLYKPYLVKEVVAPDGQTVARFSPRVIRRVDVSSKTLEIIRRGMREVALPPDGTAAGVFAGAEYSVAAKTGTAEVHGHDNHALFVAFAPYEKPEVALAVVVEYGGHGSSAAGSVAREILDAYFSLKKAPPTAGLSKEKAAGTQQAAPAPERPAASSGNNRPGRAAAAPQAPSGGAGRGSSSGQPAGVTPPADSGGGTPAAGSPPNEEETVAPPGAGNQPPANGNSPSPSGGAPEAPGEGEGQ